uniref:Chalcononaringenin 2'-O-glucosyltransferase n=1 Tax=Dianthus caryophyllus TaxID=3570 RepID=A7M6I8_DIACA|nr:tetrahydroxychalcone 2'-glucosyltransferase [Dianthus caryophyllus]BBD75333.1 chalcononaringenin 2'-O-glucosyltransferase [Dianthus caryophyllus]
MSKAPFELVFIPTPAVGHIISTVQLAKLILNKNDLIFVSIYVINFSMHSSKVNAYIDSQSRDNPYPTRLTFVSLPLLPDMFDPFSPTQFTAAIDLHKPFVKQAVEDRVRDGLPKPVGFVLDMFCTSMADIANELSVPSYVYFTSGANLLNFTFFAQSFADDHQEIDPAVEFSRPEFSAVVPGFKNPVTSAAIPAVFQEKNGCELLLGFARKFREMKGILMNTYVELENFGIHALMNGDGKKIPPIYPVGPILELGNTSTGGSDNSKDVSVIQWLDGQPKSSVVFLCFGSMGSFDEEQIKEIAIGLERSGQRYLWALRKPPSSGKVGVPSESEAFLEALPEGFIDRTISGKGKIIAWAPQVEVLAHPAVGGFVLHCGWNSTLESIWFGVPMATWPIYAEQQLNAFELVKELELAIEIRMDYKTDIETQKAGFMVKAEEIEEGIRALMNVDETMRERVKTMSDYGKKALERGGSSYNYLEFFIGDVLSNIS